MFLLRGHFLEGEPFSLARNEVPVEPLFIAQRVGRLRGLFRRQGRQKIVRRGNHLLRHQGRALRRMGPGAETAEVNEKDKAGSAFHALKSMQADEKGKSKMMRDA